MTFVQNAVDGVRRKVQMQIDGRNNGGSRIKESDGSIKEGSVETVLLSDIFEEALDRHGQKSVVIKADIESYECRTFLNSQQGIQNHLSEPFFHP